MEALAQLVVLGHDRLEFESLLHQHAQAFHINRLRQIIVRPLLHRLDGALDGPVGGHQNEERVVAMSAYAAEQLQPAQVRHLDIGNDEVVETFLSEFQRGERIGAAIHEIAFPSQCLLHASAKSLFIIDNKDPDPGPIDTCRHGSLARRNAGGNFETGGFQLAPSVWIVRANGKRIVNRAPLSGAFWAWRVPPWAVTICWAIHKPRPLPSAFVVK